MKKPILAMFMAMLGFAACTEPEEPVVPGPDETEKPEITFDAKANMPGAVSAAGGTITFSVTTNGEWDYELSSGTDSWISPDKRKTGMVLVIAENKEEAERKAELTLSSVEKPELNKKFEIVQQAFDPNASKRPQADLLDVIFNEDGTAKDISPMNNTVQYIPGAGASWYYNDYYKRIVAGYSHPVANSISSGYYRVDNSKFWSKLEDGHTLETLVRLDDGNYNDEVKPFSNHQSGGTGFLICKASRGSANFTFLPHVGGGYKWCESGVVPEVGRYYHIVGVWDKTAGKALIYIDGEKKNEVEASGSLKIANDGSRWFAIGGDPSGDNASNAWNGDIAIARIYDKALTEEEVKALYIDVENKSQVPVSFNLTDIVYLGYAEVAAGYTYTIYGNGFKSGDVLRFTSTAAPSMKLESEITLGQADGLQSASVKIPSGLPEGAQRFSITLLRNGIQKAIGVVNFTMTSNPKADPTIQVIAHRGHHADGSTATENSAASLESALKLGIYGSEFDVWVTADDKLISYHDSKLSGQSQRIDDSTYDQIKDFKLANGESLPTFDAFLEVGKKYPDAKLVCEIKTHGNATKNKRAAEAVVAAVKAKNMEAQVEYIAFDYDICKQLVAALPDAKVMFLSSNTSTAPSKVAGDKMDGIDYKLPVLFEKPEWVGEAHQLGLEVNTWTANSAADIYGAIWLGVDYITTDNPVTVRDLLKKLQFVKPN